MGPKPHRRFPLLISECMWIVLYLSTSPSAAPNGQISFHFTLSSISSSLLHCNGVDTMQGVYSAILWLRANGSDKVGVTGFSKGASLAIYSSYFHPPVDSVVAFYGTPSCLLGIPQCPVQAHFGELDDRAGFSDVETVGKLKDSMVESQFTCRVFTYPGERHGFMNESPEGINMQNQDAVQLAWSHFESWMTEYLYS